MEDWKAAQVAGEDEIIYSEKPSTNIVTAPIDQQEHDEQLQRTSFNQHRPIRLSTVDEIEDWDEHDSALRNSKEQAHTLMDKECAAEDVIRVWEDISKFIIFKMMEGQAVRIAGLGTFTFRIHKVPKNQKIVKVTKAPVFLLSNHVKQMYQLKQDQLMTSNVAVGPLNLSVIANEAKLSRGMVEGIVTEVLQAFARGIVCNKSLEFPFPFIGKLQIRDQKVTMKFYDEFCKKMGFSVPELTQEESAFDSMIPGRMTPLKLHIPTETYRSVFHLREVRSVHETSLPVPLVRINGKYLPITLACEQLEVEGMSKKMLDNAVENSKLPEVQPPCSVIPPTCPIQMAAEKKLKSKKAPLGGFKPQPMYKAQKTGDCILDKMTKCPEVMLQITRANMYKVFVNTLGADEVKSHFHRRENHGPKQVFSYTNLHPPV